MENHATVCFSSIPITFSYPVNPILYLFYYFFKLIVWVSLRVFYKKNTVVNSEKGRIDGPCIAVSNHPSTLLDPLNTAIWIRTEVYFLANASLFKTPFSRWFFNTFYCIPVERYEDTGGRPLNNAASFEKSTRFLQGGGCLYIAPEGTSYVHRRLRKIKTGTARIALAAESRSDFRLGLTILPVGLNYSDPTRFRSELLTIFGEPVRVSDFKTDWEKDETEAVQKLTDRIRNSLSALILDTQDEEEDRLLTCLETISKNENRLAPYPAFQKTYGMLGRLRRWQASEPTGHGAYTRQVFDYFEKTEILKISDLAVKNGPGVPIPLFARLLVLFPFSLIGFLVHLLPAFSAKKINDRFNKDIHWEPTYKYVAGLVTYPLFLWLQAWLLGEMMGGGWAVWGYWASIIPCGLAVERWRTDFRLAREWQRLKALAGKDMAALEGLSTTRANLVRILDVQLSGPPSAPISP